MPVCPNPTGHVWPVGFNKVKVVEFFDFYKNNICLAKLWGMDETGVQNVQKPQPVVATKEA